MNKDLLFTIGHSDRSINEFIDLLHEASITAVADVRSVPFSRHMQHFNLDQLGYSLRKHNIAYVFLGKELGARRDEQCCYLDGQAKYELIAKTPAFQSGLNRLRDGASRHRIALMCAEKDPLVCHRSILIANALREEFDFRHIATTGVVESQMELEQRLLRKWQLAGRDMFCDATDRLFSAYKKQAQEIEYSKPAQSQIRESND